MENMADQNKFWLAKCSNWLENGQWPTVISSTDVACVFHYILCVEMALLPSETSDEYRLLECYSFIS